MVLNETKYTREKIKRDRGYTNEIAHAGGPFYWMSLGGVFRSIA